VVLWAVEVVVDCVAVEEAAALLALAVRYDNAEEMNVESGFPMMIIPFPCTSASACDVSEPENVTSEFSIVQLEPLVLKLARIDVELNGMEKFVCAASIRRGRASPNVAFAVLVPSVRAVVVHPTAVLFVHVEPVNPFTQIQALPPFCTTATPPFSHANPLPDEVSAALLLGLSMTRNFKGTTTAAAIMIRMIMRMRMNPQQGRPQHFRGFLPPLAEGEMVPSSDSGRPAGQAEAGRSRTGVGVSWPGGGKAASMPERPD